MPDPRQVTKNDLEILSNLVFESFIVKEVDLCEYHFLMRTLKTEERDDISRRYKYLSNKYNIQLVLEILSSSIMFINGYEFKKNEHQYLLNKLNSKLILNLYGAYQKLDAESSEASKFIDYYVETRESRNLWSIFKTCSRFTDPFSIRKLNQYQFYWIVMNSYKDSFEEEKKIWSKVEYMTNSICAFVNPKAFRKSKSQMGIVEQLEKNEDKTKQRVVEQLESGAPVVTETDDIFSTLERLPGETDEDREFRVNTIMEKTLKGELVDEHDRIVRVDEVKTFKRYLMQKRKKVLVEKEMNKRNGMKFDSTEVLENDVTRKQFEEDKKKGFFYEDCSYIDIVKMKDFAAIPKEDKQIAFQEVMAEPIDLEKEVEIFLKGLSSNIREGHESQNVEQPLDTMVLEENVTREDESNASGNLEVRNAAEQASRMNVKVEGVDLMKQRQDKMRRVNRAMDQRRQIVQSKSDENLDLMKFEIK